MMPRRFHKTLSSGGRATQGAASGRGFTMVEMLAVLIILTILVAMAVNVGQHVIHKSKREKTAMAQKVVLEAIQSYHDTMASYPASSNDCRSLMAALSSDKNANDYLHGLPKDVYAGLNSNLLDLYGRAMWYRKSGGMGGVPVLISAGKDGMFGRDDERSDNSTDEEWEELKERWQQDNIRSDGR